MNYKVRLSGHIPLFNNILLFAKYLALYHLFETQVYYVIRVPKTRVF